MGMAAVGADPGVRPGLVMVRAAHCPSCGDVEADRDLRCPNWGRLCPAGSAGRLRPRDVVVNGESTAAAVAPAGEPSGRSGAKVVLPATSESRAWREQTERLLE